MMTGFAPDANRPQRYRETNAFKKISIDGNGLRVRAWGGPARRSGGPPEDGDRHSATDHHARFGQHAPGHIEVLRWLSGCRHRTEGLRQPRLYPRGRGIPQYDARRISV